MVISSHRSRELSDSNSDSDNNSDNNSDGAWRGCGCGYESDKNDLRFSRTIKKKTITRPHT